MGFTILALSQAIENIKPIVVQISFTASDFSPAMQAKIKRPFFNHVLGTGFFVNAEGYVITAKHVIDGALKLMVETEAGRKHFGVGLAMPNTKNMRGNFSVVPFEIIDIDAQHDIALLKLARNPFKGEVRSGIVINGKETELLFGAPIFNLDRPKDGTAIAISGYPLSEPVLVTNSGGVATCWAINMTEVPIPNAPFGFTMPSISDVYLADIEVNPGDSGAPVYDVESSMLIGLCVASKMAPVRYGNGDNVTLNGEGLFYSSGLTIVIPTEYIADLLNKNKVAYKVSS